MTMSQFTKLQKLIVTTGVAVTLPSLLKMYVGRFAICNKDNLDADLKKWDILWFWRWNAHNSDMLRTGELLYSQRPREEKNTNNKFAGRFFGFYIGVVNSVRTNVCICCNNEMACKILLNWAQDDEAEEEKSTWVNAGMAKYRSPYRVWPFRRIGHVGTTAKDAQVEHDDQQKIQKGTDENTNWVQQQQ